MTSQRDASSNVDSDLGATFDFFCFWCKVFLDLWSYDLFELHFWPSSTY